MARSDRPRQTRRRSCARPLLARASPRATSTSARWCGHKECHADNEQRYCPKCLKRTNGTGKPLAQRFFGSRGYRPYRIRHRALTRVEPRELEVSVTNENVFWKE